MIPFAILAGLMLAGALLWVLFPLFSARAQTTAGRERQLQHESALAVLREQLAELEADQAAGRLDAAAYARSREELERRALEEGEDVERATAHGPAPAWALALLVLVPLAAAGVYLSVGEPDGLDPEKIAAQTPDFTPEQIAEMVGSLEARLAQEPDNVEGWAMLARSYLVLQDFPKAIATYEKLAQLRPDHPDVLSDWADVLAATREGDLSGEPEALVRRALEIDPRHVKALALAGTAAYQREQYAEAAELWARILEGLPPGEEAVDTILASVNEARARAGMPALAAPQGVEAAPATLSLAGRLSLADTLQGQTAPADTVFVFVRPAEGGMPLAALRFSVAELPLDFDFAGVPLMNGDAPLPQSLTVVARVSKSGDASPQPGDLEGVLNGLAPDTQGAALVIDRVR